MVKIKNTNNAKYRQGYRTTKTHILLAGMKNGKFLPENNLVVSEKVKYTLIIWLSNSAPRDFLREIKIDDDKKIWTQMFMTALS